jgi:hypothetical protein
MKIAEQKSFASYASDRCVLGFGTCSPSTCRSLQCNEEKRGEGGENEKRKEKKGREEKRK